MKQYARYLVVRGGKAIYTDSLSLVAETDVILRFDLIEGQLEIEELNTNRGTWVAVDKMED